LYGRFRGTLVIVTSHRRLLSTLLTVVLAGALAGCEGIDLSAPPATNVPANGVPAGTLDAATAKARLAELADGAPGTLAGYTRDCEKGQACVFGQPWLDVDGDGCDQRSQVLARDLVNVQRKPGRCAVTDGTLNDPYTGETITSVSKIQIDHVVPLAEMWRTGAANWTQEQRAQAANNLGNLVAVKGTTNQQKGDKTPDLWLPPNAGYHCNYARIYVTTKLTYKFTVTVPERAALTKALGTCT
jgi:Protein of unknown function (DUF1524)